MCRVKSEKIERGWWMADGVCNKKESVRIINGLNVCHPLDSTLLLEVVEFRV